MVELASGPDAFNPGVGGGGGTPDWVYADQKRDCERERVGMRGRVWDSVTHRCMELDGSVARQAYNKDVRNPQGTVSQYGWREDSGADGGDGGGNGGAGRVEGMGWRFEDLRRDCERRGAAYKWAYPADSSKPGKCLKYGAEMMREVQSEDGSPHDASGVPEWKPLDYHVTDLRNECERRGYVWEEEETGRGEGGGRHRCVKTR